MSLNLYANIHDHSRIPRTASRVGFLIAPVLVAFVSIFGGSPALAARAARDEVWKPAPHGQVGDVGAMVGAASFATAGAFAFLVTADVTILPEGLLRDFTNQLDLGLELGPVTFSAGTATMFNAYAKWNFLYDSLWTFYGLGGVGTLFLPNGLGGGSAIYPHLAIGTQLYILPQLALRAEISHAFTGVGATFSF